MFYLRDSIHSTPAGTRGDIYVLCVLSHVAGGFRRVAVVQGASQAKGVEEDPVLGSCLGSG